MVATVFSLLMLNGGFLLILFPLSHRMIDVMLAPVMPSMFAIVPGRYDAMRCLLTGAAVDRSVRVEKIVEAVLACLASLVGYAGAATLLTLRLGRLFDRRADRPTRPPAVKRAGSGG
jgi:hypothetical protein